MLKIDSIVVGMVQTNCYFVSNTETNEVILIDPGAEEEQILRELRRRDFKLCGILLTHGHFDHIMAVNGIKQAFSVKVYAGEQEEALLKDSVMNCSDVIGEPYVVVPDVCLKDGEVIELAGFQVKTIHTPGHTEGGVCYHITSDEGQEALFCGDTLFMESVGRTDLPTGNARKLLESMKKLFTLDEDLLAYPGHGPKTRIGYEKVNNIFA